MNVRVRRNQVGDALHAGQQGGVGGLERIDDADGAIGKLKQSIVRNHDQRIDFLAQILNAKCCGSRTLGTFKAERAGNHRNGQGHPADARREPRSGLAPVPVPPPSPQVTNTISAPLSDSSISD